MCTLTSRSNGTSTQCVGKRGRGTAVRAPTVNPATSTFVAIKPSLPVLFKNRPELEINIFGQTFSALLDSGASCSAMSESTFTILQQNHGTREKLTRLPVHGVTVLTALRARSKKLTTQVLIKFLIIEQQADCIFLVIPNLATPIILGDDWLSRYNVVLDYLLDLVRFPQWNLEYPFRQISESVLAPNVISSLRVHEHHEMVYNTNYEHTCYALQSVIEHTYKSIDSEVNLRYLLSAAI